MIKLHYMKKFNSQSLLNGLSIKESILFINKDYMIDWIDKVSERQDKEYELVDIIRWNIEEIKNNSIKKVNFLKYLNE